jgi:hypothetical protein
MKLSGRRILVLVSDTMVGHSIRDVLEQEGAIGRPVVKSLVDAGVRLIGYTGDAACFQKRFPGTPVISKPAADAHFISAVDLLLNTNAKRPNPLGQQCHLLRHPTNMAVGEPGGCRSIRNRLTVL